MLTVAALTGAVALDSATAEMPSLMWRGVERVALLCHVVASPPVDNQRVGSALCRRAAAIAARDAPVPVSIVAWGDPALRARGTVSLFIHGSVTEIAPGRRVLALAARTENASAAEPDANPFGAAPRAAPFSSDATPSDWDAALTASLQQLLPWLRPAGTGELSPKKGENE